MVSFNRTGNADPQLARSSVKRLYGLAQRARDTKLMVETVYEQGTGTDAKKLMGVVSAHLSSIEESAAYAIDDWCEFHFDALSEIVKEGQNGQGAD